MTPSDSVSGATMVSDVAPYAARYLILTSVFPALYVRLSDGWTSSAPMPRCQPDQAALEIDARRWQR